MTEDVWTQQVWEDVKGMPEWYQTLYFLICMNYRTCEKCASNWDRLLFVEENYQT